MDLEEAYAVARFQSTPPPQGRWPERYAIVTAHNPDGQTVAAELNRQYDEQLADRLERDGNPFWRVTGGNADFSHAEPGFAIQTSLDAALATGRFFRQQAIFWVEQGDLFLVNCADGGRRFLGRWEERQDP